MRTPHTHPSSFYWNSDLSEDRKLEICEWVKSLTPAQFSMLGELLNDVQEETEFNYRDYPD